MHLNDFVGNYVLSLCVTESNNFLLIHVFYPPPPSKIDNACVDCRGLSGKISLHQTLTNDITCIYTRI